MDNKYEVLSALKKEKLALVRSHGIACDIWTEKMTTVSFLGVTTHYLDENGKPASTRLGTRELCEPRTAAYLKRLLGDVLEYWGIQQSSVKGCVTDGGADIKKAMSEMFPGLHVPCFAHLVNNVGEDTTKLVEELTTLNNTVKRLVTWFRYRVDASRELKKEQEKKGLIPKRLVQECITRWNTKYEMMERYLELQNDVSIVLFKRTDGPDILNVAERGELREIVRLLKPLKEVTQDISGQKYITLSLVLPLTHCMKSYIQGVQTTTDVGRALKKQLLQSISTRLETLEKVPLIAMATILDPRFKKMYFQNPMNALHAIDDINKRLKATSRSRREVVPEPMEPMEPEVPDLWTYHEKKCAQENKKLDGPDDRRNLCIDLTQYLSRENLDRHTDVLEYWKHQEQNCPALAKVALDILAIPGAAVPVERLFSAAHGIMEPTRNRLTPDHLERLLFLESLNLEEWHFES